ncbi:MAG: ParB/RepB/Spo0J family partition protein [Candidatus Kapabacteria bacterium]|jgi:ParB family chromosome partitioning protein|nr:ParB/RepB/Spo0J family partition protein [Candidatus Kapabacteria bacterium]
MTKSKKLKQGLGKGLGALLPSIEISDDGYTISKDKQEAYNEHFALIDLNDIVRNPLQPRSHFDIGALEGLKQSIIKNGVIVPITVRRAPNGFELIAGERRFRASKEAGLKNIPAYILNIDTDAEMLEMALIENVQRENLNPIEVALGYSMLIEECKLTQEQVASKIGKDRSTITNFLRLLKLPGTIQSGLKKNELSMGHARAILGLNDPGAMQKVHEIVHENRLSVRATEALVKDIINGKYVIGSGTEPKKTVKKKKQTKSHLNPEEIIIIEDYEKKLRHGYGTEVKISTKSKESGMIQFEFYSKDDFDRLMEIFIKLNKG